MIRAATALITFGEMHFLLIIENDFFIFGKIHFLLTSENEFFCEIKRDGITSLHGIHVLATTRKQGMA